MTLAAADVGGTVVVVVDEDEVGKMVEGLRTDLFGADALMHHGYGLLPPDQHLPHHASGSAHHPSW